MIFTTERQIRFHHCDPAGIVFYPQFFYLLHEAKEDFLAHIGFPQHEMIKSGFGTPIVDIKTRFLGMCRYGDDIAISVTISKIGNSSLGMDYELRAAGQTRGTAGVLKLQACSVLVYSGLADGKPLRIPEDFRAALRPYLHQLQNHPQETLQTT